MKLPSIIKIPAHNRFHYEPRYYDPIKEEIEERRKRIRQQMEAEQAAGHLFQPRARIEGAFTRRVTSADSDNSALLRLTIMALLMGATVGYLFWGNIAVYISAGVALALLLLKKLLLK